MKKMKTGRLEDERKKTDILNGISQISDEESTSSNLKR